MSQPVETKSEGIPEPGENLLGTKELILPEGLSYNDYIWPGNETFKQPPSVHIFYTFANTQVRSVKQQTINGELHSFITVSFLEYKTGKTYFVTAQKLGSADEVMVDIVVPHGDALRASLSQLRPGMTFDLRVSFEPKSLQDVFEGKEILDFEEGVVWRDAVTDGRVENIRQNMQSSSPLD